MPHVIHNRLDSLTPDTRAAAIALMNGMKSKGYDIRPGETYREPARQARLYALSESLVSQGKAPITKTRKSWHETGRAVDFSIHPFAVPDILVFLDLARSLGFRTIADPDKVRAALDAGDSAAASAALWDAHHVEFRAGRTWEQAANEYTQLQKAPETPTANLAEIASAVIGTGAILGAINGNTK